ncbi:hypothetical protein [Nitrosomonas sp. Nm33]|uniref:lipase family protein n=1 Tax=Nitrosomonas sp. Nm33 TaxID=133724 RepID=UPI0008947282|nr:hypothetical protein [Nitrosomonas sp. Nm33]SDY46414.1 Lipase (class 3) [Nitrosomonas sp. Nm33]
MINEKDVVKEQLRDERTHRVDTIGFKTNEAKQLLEFCIELNNQDDRNAHPDNSEFKPDLGQWKIIKDSRAGKKDDPTKNGFGPFNNAWIALQKSAGDEYALAIRGTVGQARSILNDVLATTIPADSGIEFPKNRNLPITFATTPRAEVHLGFAYAAFSMLFDNERGIVNLLRSGLIPPGAKLFITGHSQGAAIGTLVHAYLHYAITDPTDRYQLKDKRLTLKSYVFAQPKPGNYQFALDFARVAGHHGTAFVINNNLDAVPQLPINQQTIAESIADAVSENQGHGRGASGVLIDGLAKAGKAVFWARNLFAEHIANKVDKLYSLEQAKNIDTSYFDGIAKIPEQAVNSLNYTLSGTLIPVFGISGGGNLYPPASSDKPDLLLQHHATTYRKLINQQL